MQHSLVANLVVLCWRTTIISLPPRWCNLILKPLPVEHCVTLLRPLGENLQIVGELYGTCLSSCVCVGSSESLALYCEWTILTMISTKSYVDTGTGVDQTCYT